MISLPKRLGRVTVLGKNCDFPEGTNTRTAFMIQRKTSCMGNPHVKGVHGDKATVIRLFREDLDKAMLDPTSDIYTQMQHYIALLISGKDVHLKCGCKPAACHGDEIKEVLELTLRKMIAFPEDDGVTHINVYSKGKTSVGRDLTNFAYTPFIHPELGAFDSIEGLWFFLSSGTLDPTFRKLAGAAAKRYISRLERKTSYNLEEFKRLIKLGLDAKFKAHPIILQKLERDYPDLPLMHYYVDDKDKSKVTDPIKHFWVIEYIELLRKKPNTPTSNKISLDIELL